MEVLLLVASVTGVGYFLSDKKQDVAQPKLTYLNVENTKPNGLNIYQSDKVNEIKKQELQKSNLLYELAKTPSLTGVLPPHFNSLYNLKDEGNEFLPLEPPEQDIQSINFSDFTSDNKATVLDNVFINPNSQQSSILNNVNRYINPIKTKSLALPDRPMFKSTAPQDPTGILSEEQFGTLNNNSDINPLTGLPFDTKHNNMTPFFGSHVKEGLQNTDILEKFTGTEDTFKNKTENLNQINAAENIYGNVPLTATIAADLDRYIPSKFRQNEKPIAEIRDSYQFQGSLNDQFRPEYKKIEDLVVNPKVSYEGRINTGAFPAKRAEEPAFSKNRVDTFYESGVERAFVKSDVNKGLLDKSYIENLKNPQREDISTDYSGNLNSSHLQHGKQRLRYCNDLNEDMNELQDSCIREPFKNQYNNNYASNVSKIGSVDDFGKQYVQLPNTQRITSNAPRLPSYNGSKIGTTRLQDILPVTLKETLLGTDNSGNIKSQHNLSLSESTSRGINNLNAKTTLKEDLGIITNKYIGVANKNEGLGYLTNNVNAKITLKEILTNQSEYTGNPTSQDKKSFENREQFNTVKFRDNREQSLIRKNNNGPQKFSSINNKKDMFLNEIRLSAAKKQNDKEDNRENLNLRFPQRLDNYQNLAPSRKDRYKETDISDRFSNGFHLDQLKNNPYNIYSMKS
jgi:hypothetical protein